MHNDALISFHDEDEALSKGRWADIKGNPFNTLGRYVRYFYSNIMPNIEQFKLNKTEERWNPVDITQDDFDQFLRYLF